MKKFNRAQIIISLAAILVAAVIAGYGLIAAISTITSKVNFTVADKNLDFTIEANVDWSNELHSVFKAETTPNGLNNTTWDFPDVTFDDGAGAAVMTLVFKNKNPGSVIKLDITGIPTDTDPNKRFEVVVKAKLSTSGVSNIITPVQGVYTIEIPKATVNTSNQDVVVVDTVANITFEYHLLRENSSFSIDQELHFDISNGEE